MNGIRPNHGPAKAFSVVWVAAAWIVVAVSAETVAAAQGARPTPATVPAAKSEAAGARPSLDFSLETASANARRTLDNMAKLHDLTGKAAGTISDALTAPLPGKGEKGRKSQYRDILANAAHSLEDRVPEAKTTPPPPAARAATPAPRKAETGKPLNLNMW